MQGIAVGSRSSFEAMKRAITQHDLRPVIEQTFPPEKTRDAFALIERGGHFGKIAITLEKCPTQKSITQSSEQNLQD